MRKSIQATNVVLNLAVVPNVILMPSNFVILSKKIRGYNNVLTTATKDMTFGVNKNVNYVRSQNSQNSASRNTSHGNDSGEPGLAHSMMGVALLLMSVALAGATLTSTLVLTITTRNYHHHNSH